MVREIGTKIFEFHANDRVCNRLKKKDTASYTQDNYLIGIFNPSKISADFPIPSESSREYFYCHV